MGRDRPPPSHRARAETLDGIRLTTGENAGEVPKQKDPGVSSISPGPPTSNGARKGLADPRQTPQNNRAGENSFPEYASHASSRERLHRLLTSGLSRRRSVAIPEG